MDPLSNSGIIDTFNGSPVFQDYIPSLLHIAEDCKKIITLLTAIKEKKLPDKIRLDHDFLKRKFQLLQNAVQPNQNLDYKTKDYFFQIMQLLADLPDESINGQVWSPAIIRIATIASKLSDVERAIRDVSLFLIPSARKLETFNPNDLERSCKIVAFAQKYFDILDEDKKASLTQVKALLQTAQPQSFKENAGCTKNHAFLIKALSILPPAVPVEPPKPIPPAAVDKVIWQEPKRAHSEPLPKRNESKADDAIDSIKAKFRAFGELFTAEKKEGPQLNECSLAGFVLITKGYSASDEDKIQASIYKASQVKKDQLKIFADLTHLFIDHYARSWFTTPENTSINLIVDQYLKDFDKLIPQFILKYFFQEPRGISDQEKSFLSSLFNALAQFFIDLKEDEKFSSETYQVETSTYHLIDKLLVYEIEELINFFMPTFDTQDPERSHIHQLAKKTITTFLFKGIDNILTPYHFSLFIDRLLDKKIDLTGPEENLPSYDAFPAMDEKFNIDLGNAFLNIGKVLVEFGNPSGMMSAVGSLLLKILKANRLQLGETVQKAFCRLTNSECSMVPFLILRHVFFDKVNEAYVPTMLGMVNKTEQEQNEAIARVQIKIKERLYPIILDQIKGQSHFAASFMSSFSSIEEFCNTLSSQLFKITKNQTLLKILLLYILKGLIGNLKQND